MTGADAGAEAGAAAGEPDFEALLARLRQHGGFLWNVTERVFDPAMRSGEPEWVVIVAKWVPGVSPQQITKGSGASATLALRDAVARFERGEFRIGAKPPVRSPAGPGPGVKEVTLDDLLKGYA